jgi:hypothetical protein
MADRHLDIDSVGAFRRDPEGVRRVDCPLLLPIFPGSPSASRIKQKNRREGGRAERRLRHSSGVRACAFVSTPRASPASLTSSSPVPASASSSTATSGSAATGPPSASDFSAVPTPATGSPRSGAILSAMASRPTPWRRWARMCYGSGGQMSSRTHGLPPPTSLLL